MYNIVIIPLTSFLGSHLSGAGGQHDYNENGFYVVWRNSDLLDNNDHLNFSVSKGKKTFHIPVKVTILRQLRRNTTTYLQKRRTLIETYYSLYLSNLGK